MARRNVGAREELTGWREKHTQPLWDPVISPRKAPRESGQAIGVGWLYGLGSIAAAIGRTEF